MAVRIKNLAGIKPNTYPYYFFDANVWLCQLKASSSLLQASAKAHEASYVKFFDSVINHAVISKTPNVICTGLLISEIFNAYLRFSHTIYRSAHPICTDFKRDYRPTPDYSQNLSTIVGDFSAFKDYLTLFDDNLNEVDPFSILSTLTPTNDFNDVYYYFHLMEIKKKTSLALVTHDANFIFHDVDVLTTNPYLLKL